jgi:AraC-like DNA-binding protein
VPSFSTAGRLVTPSLRAKLVRCDGRDGARGESEHVDGEQVWIVVAGRFAWRDRRGRAVIDPATALLLAAGEPFEVRHPGGGDVCLSLGGQIASELVHRHAPGSRPLRLEQFLRWSSLAARLRAGAAVDALELEEALCATAREPAASVAPPSRRELAVAEAIDYELQLHAAEAPPLAGLAAAAGVSVFHACRVYRRVRGSSIHQRRKALRVRHALAYLRDTRWPLARVAAECGFASQAHMTHCFRRELGLTPRVARERRG